MESVIEKLKQYRYGILILLLGIGLMLLPSGEHDMQSDPEIRQEEAMSISESLEQILGQIEGVGRVKVMLTQSAGEITIYQEDTDHSADTVREDTVLVTGESRQEMGLVRQVIPPKYQGAVVVCQGGDRAAVRLAIVDAVAAVTGLTSDRITVLKMK